MKDAAFLYKVHLVKLCSASLITDGEKYIAVPPLNFLIGVLFFNFYTPYNETILLDVLLGR